MQNEHQQNENDWRRRSFLQKQEGAFRESGEEEFSFRANEDGDTRAATTREDSPYEVVELGDSGPAEKEHDAPRRISRNTALFFTIGAGVILFYALLFVAYKFALPEREEIAKDIFGTTISHEDIANDSVFHYNFNGEDVIEEAPSEQDSIDPYWWLNSGARILISGGTGKTIFGELAPLSGWRAVYARANPGESDNGEHPQNVFRLFTKYKSIDSEQSVYFRITRLRMSESPSRNESNGVFLMNRYQNGNKLYYAGVRVDGMAAVKKKNNGEYFTMAMSRVFGEGDYDRGSRPNFLPIGEWIGLRTRFESDGKGGVTIQLWIDRGNGDGWEEAIAVHDDGEHFGGPVIAGEGASGIRSDFMDAEFDNYRLVKLK